MWWLISRFTSLFSMAQQWSRAMMTHRGGIYFWKTIPLAHVFVFRGSNTKLFFTICLLYFSDILWDERNTPTHLTSDMHPMNDNISFSLRLWSHACKSPHSTWHHDNSSHLEHTMSEWRHLTPALIAHMKTSFQHDIFTPTFRAHPDMDAYIKEWFAYVKHDFVNFQVSIAVSLALQVSIISGGSYHIEHGSLQLSRTEH